MRRFLEIIRRLTEALAIKLTSYSAILVYQHVIQMKSIQEELPCKGLSEIMRATRVHMVKGKPIAVGGANCFIASCPSFVDRAVMAKAFVKR